MKNKILSMKRLVEQNRSVILYQIVLLGTPFYDDELQEKLKVDEYVRIVDKADVNRLYPCIYLYFGKTEGDKANTTGLDLNDLSTQGKLLTIVQHPDHVPECIPDEACSINAFVLDRSTEIERLKNLILKYFNRLDSNKKVFISYRRKECSGLADQLFSALSRKGYKPFLDSYVIEPMEQFQNVLMHKLSDSEIFIFLNSPTYLKSKWCKKEIKLARKHNIGVLQIDFNGAGKVHDLVNKKVLSISQSADEKRLYSNGVLQWILWNVENLRALSFEYRRASICNSIFLKNQGKDLFLQDGIIINRTDGEAYVPYNYIPSSESLHDAGKSVDIIDSTLRKFLCYNGEKCMGRKREHLEWLNSCLPVKAVDIND